MRFTIHWTGCKSVGNLPWGWWFCVTLIRHSTEQHQLRATTCRWRAYLHWHQNNENHHWWVDRECSGQIRPWLMFDTVFAELRRWVPHSSFNTFPGRASKRRMKQWDTRWNPDAKSWNCCEWLVTTNNIEGCSWWESGEPFIGILAKCDRG